MTVRVLLCIAAAALPLAACNGGSDEPAACRPAQAQAIDPLSSQHLFPGATEPPYSTNPPTSGAHAPGNHPQGVLAEPISRPVQVALLEAGAVLVQYKDIPAAQLRELRAFAGAHDVVTVAPNDSLPSPVVATAWLYLQRCTRVDNDALADFVAAHGGKHASD